MCLVPLKAQLPAPQEEQNIVQLVGAINRRAIAVHEVAIGGAEPIHWRTSQGEIDEVIE